jgi:hypothetical protein
MAKNAGRRQNFIHVVVPKQICAFIIGGFSLIAFSLVGVAYLSGGIASANTTIVASNTYTWENWPSNSTGYTSLQWSVTPLTDPSPDGYFWSNQFYFNNANGNAAYFGLQTEGTAPTGKIAIFSAWSALASQSPQYAKSFSGEGTGYTARISFKWNVGTKYDLQVQRLNIVATGTVSKIITGTGSTPVAISWSGQSAFPTVLAGQTVYITGKPYKTSQASTDGTLYFAAGTKITTNSAIVFSQSLVPDPESHTGVPNGTWWGAWIWKDGTQSKQFVGEVEVPLSWGNITDCLL